MSIDTATETTANVLGHEECGCGSEKYCPRATSRLNDTEQSCASDTDEAGGNADNEEEQQQLPNRNSCRFARQLTASAEPLTNNKAKGLVQQRSILKNSIDRQQEENEVLEAKKQLILRRRRLYSHYRQYEQWRRRQFSYDPCYLVNITPKGSYASMGMGGDLNGVGVGGGFGGNRAAAGRRRRQYRRQFSCAEESENLLKNNEHRERNKLQKCHSSEVQQQYDYKKIYQSTSPNLHSEPASVSSALRFNIDFAAPSTCCIVI